MKKSFKLYQKCSINIAILIYNPRRKRLRVFRTLGEFSFPISIGRIICFTLINKRHNVLIALEKRQFPTFEDLIGGQNIFAHSNGRLDSNDEDSAESADEDEGEQMYSVDIGEDDYGYDTLLENTD